VSDLSAKDPLNNREYALSIDVKAYRRSSHGALKCATCHEWGYDRVPHRAPRGRDPYACVYCHRNDDVLKPYQLEKRKGEFKKSHHVDTFGRKFGCHDCHDPHRFFPIPKGKGVRPQVDRANDICARCHAAKKPLMPFEDAPPLSKTHEWLPNQEAHFAALSCVTCHAKPGGLNHEVRLAKEAQQDCRGCHGKDAEKLGGLYTATKKPAGGGNLFDVSNQSLFEEAYVIGATRSPLLDRLSQVGFALCVAFVLTHGLALAVARRRRRAEEEGLRD
jgi:hypothetical protein